MSDRASSQPHIALRRGSLGNQSDNCVHVPFSTDDGLRVAAIILALAFQDPSGGPDMNILDSIMNAGNGAAVRQLGAQLGLDEAQTASALSALVPALAAGLRKNVQSPDGLSGLVSALSGGAHQRYIDDPAVLGDVGTVADGNGILGHVLGSKDVSRQVAAQAGAQTGIGTDVMKRMLPLVATLVMGAMSRQAASGGGSPLASAGGGGGLLDMLGGALDQNRDGSALDDILGSIGRTFGRS
jgi:hypothetical protein